MLYTILPIHWLSSSIIKVHLVVGEMLLQCACLILRVRIWQQKILLRVFWQKLIAMLITVGFLHICVSCHYQVSLIFLLNHIILFPRAASSNPIVPPCMFNCTIFPRGTCENDNGSERIHIFRCALQPVDYLYQKEIPSIKNHYVALCQSKSSSSTS